MTGNDRHPSRRSPDRSEVLDGRAEHVDRRRLLHGVGLMAGATGAAALLAAAPTSAQAADGAPVALGRRNQSTRTTTVQIAAGSGSAEPALTLTNASGPALQIDPLTDIYRGDLEVGQIVGQSTGPLIGVDYGDGPETTYVALGSDVAAIPTPFAFAPVRLLDTRRPATDDTVVATSSDAFDSAHRLRGGAWLDLGVLPATDVLTAQAVFVNVTVTQPEASGFLTLCPPGPRPGTSSINFVKSQTVANGGFFAVGLAGEFVAIRIYASATTHVVLDVTGYTVLSLPGPLATSETRKAARTVRPRLSAGTARRHLAARTAR